MRKRRVTGVFLLLFAGFLVVEARLLQLQIVEHETWAWEARRTARSYHSLPFERGWILDRNGEPLARTEELADLTFRYRSWRRGTVVGGAALALRHVDGRRRPMRTAYDEARGLLEELSHLPLADLVALQPRHRRTDLAWYLGRVFGQEVAGALSAGLAEGEWGGAREVSELPGFDRGAAQAMLRAADERDALHDLAYLVRTTPQALMATLDEAVVEIDERVVRIAARTAEGDDFDRTRDLHAEFDDDPALALSPVPYDTETLVALRAEALAGFAVTTKRRRTYPPAVADLATVLIGKVGQPNPADIERAEANRLRLADLAAIESLTPEELSEFERLRVIVREIDYGYTEERGVLGLERALEALLRGKRGYIARTPAAAGGDGEEEIDRVSPQRGLNVTLTLDVNLQRACEKVVDGVLEGFESEGEQHPGVPAAIVLLDPRTGAVRALATSPRPRREQFSTDYAELMADPRGPLFQRAISTGVTGNLPPPGSTFKAVVALAGLAEGVITPTETLLCTRRMTIGDQLLSCLGTHGEIAMDRALAKSCNHYFFWLADRIGGDRLLHWTRLLGFGHSTSMLLDNEVLAASGVQVGFGVTEAWNPLPAGNIGRVATMRLGIGQAPLDDVTPAQVAAMMGAIGTGVLRPPMLVASIEGYGPVEPRAATEFGLSAAHLAAVRHGLQSVTAPGGTADALDREALRRLGIDVAGKTGTPEVDQKPDHSWFAGYFPQDEPVLAFAILLEHSGKHGGDAGVPVFNTLLNQPELAFYLGQELTP